MFSVTEESLKGGEGDEAGRKSRSVYRGLSIPDLMPLTLPDAYSIELTPSSYLLEIFTNQQNAREA